MTSAGDDGGERDVEKRLKNEVRIRPPTDREWLEALDPTEAEYFKTRKVSSEALEEKEIKCTTCQRQVNHKVRIYDAPCTVF